MFYFGVIAKRPNKYVFQFLKVAFILANCAAGSTLFTKLPILAGRICINFEVNHAFDGKKHETLYMTGLNKYKNIQGHCHAENVLLRPPVLVLVKNDHPFSTYSLYSL